MAVIEDLSEEEAYLWAILTDTSGLDIAEFAWYDAEHDDGCFRAWPFQWTWWRCTDPLQIDQCARSIGKSLSVKVRAFAFPFLHPGQEMVITAPEGVHLEAITDIIETQFYNSRLGKEMLVGGRSSVKHKPFHMNFTNGARIMGRIPQRDGRGVKGCVAGDTPIVTARGILCTDELVVGDLVLTHEGRWKPVVDIFVDVNDAYEVRGQSSFPMTVSCDHRFFGMQNMGTRKTKRKLEWPAFYDVETLLDDQVYWATPTTFPVLPIPEIVFEKAHRSFSASGPEFWWLVGRYLADGYLSHHRPNGKSGSVHWCVVPEKAAEIRERLESIGLNAAQTKRSHSSADILSVHSSPWNDWLVQHFGKHSDSKHLPVFVLGMPAADRSALLAGYVSGDGCFEKERDRISLGTASKMLAVGIQLLAQSLGYSVNCSTVQPLVTEINGAPLKGKPKVSYRLQLQTGGYPIRAGDFLYSKVKSVRPVGKIKVYNPIIEDDHSYVSGSIVSHNVHPLWLETDEGQDYPDRGWIELTETLKRGHAGAVWRVHGVTRGVRDYFFKFTSDPNSKWTVHRITAMHRPTWTDEERQEKIEQYGGRDDPNYRRNILGAHGDAVSPLFVLHRLMQCVDDEKESEYNTEEYQFFKISDSSLRETGIDIIQALDFPHSHTRKYKTFWIGMDVGMTNHPSEILVFAEERPKADEVKWLKQHKKAVPPDGYPRLKLITRINLTRVGSPEQARVILWVIDFYKPKAFSLDKTGLGLPLFQEVQTRNKQQATIIKGYGFSEKLLVDFDQTIDVDSTEVSDLVKEAGIHRNVVEYSTDVMRKLVDEKRMWLPWDPELIGEFQGQTYKVVQTALNAYGRREFSAGKFHALDAARMAVLGWAQHSIEEMTKVRANAPVLDAFIAY